MFQSTIEKKGKYYIMFLYFILLIDILEVSATKKSLSEIVICICKSGGYFAILSVTRI